MVNEGYNGWTSALRLELSHVRGPRRSPVPAPGTRGPGHAGAGPGRPAGGAERKNGWQLAEVNGDADPYGIQYLLNRARWSVAEARTALCGYVEDHLGDPQVVGIIDETAFLKKGTHSAGVARQYSGTAGRVENCQVGVFLAYAGAQGYALLDAELYLPKGWTDKPARLQGVGLAPDTPFATRPQLAQRLLSRAQAAGVSLAWVVGDTVHGHLGRLRAWLEDQTRPTCCWRCRPTKRSGAAGTRLWGERCMRPWPRGTGSKGERWYDWQCLVLAEAADADKGYCLLFQRACGQPEAWRAYLVWGPPACDLPTLSGSPTAAGALRAPLRWPSRKWAWTSMRCATPGAGTATWSWPCSAWCG